MKKSEFLGHLSTAVTRMRARMEPKHLGVVGRMSGDRTSMALGHAVDLGIYFANKLEGEGDLDNPVVLAIELISSFEASEVPVLECLGRVEVAWEFVEANIKKGAPYLRFEQGRWVEYRMDGWVQEDNFLVFAHNE